MGSSVSRASRASNRVEPACTHNPLEQQARHLPLGDQLHRLPGARPTRCDAGPRCGLFYKRCHLRAIAFTKRSTPPRYPSSQLSCCGRRGGHLPVCATHETKGPTAPVFRALRTPSHASTHHCFGPLRACSNAWRPSALTSLSQPARTGHGREASHVASCVGLCNVYWPCRESQTYQHTHITHHIAITAPCRGQTPHDNNARLPLDTTCYTGTPHVTQQ